MLTQYFPPLFCYDPVPFADPVQSVWDTIRVIDQIGGGALIVALLVLTVKTSMLGRKVLSIGIMLLVVSVVGTEFEALGTPPTYRLFVNTFGLLVVAAGIALATTRREG